MKKTILFLLLSFLLVNCKSSQADEQKPNIIFILSDDHTAQAWGIYDGIYQEYAKNDNIKRLAAEGTILDNVFCTNSICVPSRASILTGKYSHQNGIYTLSEGLNPDSIHIAKLLQTAGYETAIIGKWHLKKQPSGFDHFLVLPGQGRYDDPILKTAADWEDGNQGGSVYKGYSADVIGDQSIQWLQGRKKEQPFMLMMHFKATHGPFDYPDRYKGLYENITLPEPASLYDFDPASNRRSFPGQPLEELGRRMVYGTENPDSYWGSAPGLPFSLAGLDSIAARKKIYQLFAKNFLRAGAAIDDNIGKVLDYLDEAGLSENTVVIYTSDQGYFMGEHGFFDKRLMYEESLRMPFVLRYPMEVPAGQRLDDMILNVDFPLLFADYAGLPAPTGMQGRSFRSNLQGQTPTNWRQSMYYRYWLHHPIRPAHFGIRNERYKLIFYYGQGLGKPGSSEEATSPAWEFFDLQNDPKEMQNAYEDATYQAIIADMKEELIHLRKELKDTDKSAGVMQEILSQHLTVKQIMRCITLSFLLLIFASCSHSSPPEEAKKQLFSEETASKLDSLFRKAIQYKKIPGAVALVAEAGELVYHKALGYNNIAASRRQTTDDLFRIASMTKPITAVAAMMLFEEGKFQLDDPLTKHLPAFAEPQILDEVNLEDSTFTAHPAASEITIRQLFTHSSGIGYGFQDEKLMTIFEKAGITEGFEERDILLKDNVNRIAQMPLLHEPGDRFTYGLNSDVLGYLVELWSGLPLDSFLHKRIFAPLGMNDTHFYLPKQKASRLTEVYMSSDTGVVLSDYPLIHYPTHGAKRYLSGGADLSCTAHDYYRFCQMLLNGGTLAGRQILEAKTVDLMTRTHLESGEEDMGLGFGIMSSKSSSSKKARSIGSYSWGGFFTTTFWIDPKEDLIAILLLQMYPFEDWEIVEEFEALIYHTKQRYLAQRQYLESVVH